MELRDRTVVVTGGASGIGAACVRAFAAEGAHVVVADVQDDLAAAVAGETGGHAVHCDVGSEADVNALVAETEARFGPIDVFFSNAAVATGGDPLTTDIDVWDEQWRINLMAHVFAVRAVLPGMLERGWGYLLHTASMAGILTSQGNATYAVTKHAVVGLAEWMAIAYHDRGIRVSLLAPLGVNTPMLGGMAAPGRPATARTRVGDRRSSASLSAVGPVKEPEEVARQVLDAVHEERFLILTDPIAQTWMERKTNDLERWLHGMRRLQRRMTEGE